MNKEHEAIVQDLQRIIREDWPEADRNAFYLTGIKDDVSITSLHHTLGRWIRNNYNLWKIPYTPEIRNGIDYSPYHPDAISDTILREVWCRGLQHKENK